MARDIGKLESLGIGKQTVRAALACAVMAIAGRDLLPCGEEKLAHGLRLAKLREVAGTARYLVMQDEYVAPGALHLNPGVGYRQVVGVAAQAFLKAHADGCSQARDGQRVTTAEQLRQEEEHALGIEHAA